MKIPTQSPSHALAQALNPVDPGNRPKSANDALKDDAQRLGRLRDRVVQFREPSQGAEAKLSIRSSDLAKEIGEQIRNQYGYDRDVSLDQIGPTNFTQRRAALLKRVPGGQCIAAQYGQTFAAEMSDFAPFYPRMMIDNEAELDYHREKPAPTLQKSLEWLYARLRDSKAHGVLPKDHDVVFVNSADTLNLFQKYLSASPGQGAVGEKLQDERLGRGIFAVPVPKKLRQAAEELIVLMGARPSSYQAKRVLCGKLPDIPKAKIDNKKHIELLEPDLPNAPTRRLRLADPNIGTGAMAHTAADLVDSLYAVLTEHGRLKEKHIYNPMLMYGLNGISAHVEELNSLHNDTIRFSNAYRAMMEELHVALVATRPYTEKDFKKIANEQLTARLNPAILGSLKEVEVYMTTSGMGAIMQGLSAAINLNEEKSFKLLSTKLHGNSPIYFEATRLMEVLGQKPSATSRTLMAVLNNSYPAANGHSQEPWGVKAVVDATRAEVAQQRPGARPLILILDTTVEHREDLPRLTDGLKDELLQGKLQIVMCKSYQKYANLCSSKVMAGNITLLGTDIPERKLIDDYLRAAERSNDWINNDEAQLMTHFVSSGQHEFQLFDRSVANANFVRDTCFTGQGDHAAFDGHHRHLPFAMVSMYAGGDDFNSPALQIRNAAGHDTSHKFEPHDDLDEHMIRQRDSFGFAETVQADMPNTDGYNFAAVRLSFGQESKAELTEMFYMPSRLLLKEGSTADPRDVRAHMNDLINDALTPDQRRDTADKSLAHKLALVGANEAATLDDSQRLSNVASMRRILEQQKSQQGFTLNKIVSVVGHFGNMVLNQKLLERLASGPDRGVVEPLLDGLIGSNMPGVSRVGRETVARFHAELCSFDMKSENPEQRRRGVERLVDGLSRMNVASRRGAYVDVVSDALLAEQPAKLRERLLDLVFQPLSPKAQIALIDRHLNNGHLNFAEACIDRIGRQDIRRTPGLSNVVAERRATLAKNQAQS